jgi:hypothetical protein
MGISLLTTFYIFCIAENRFMMGRDRVVSGQILNLSTVAGRGHFSVAPSIFVSNNLEHCSNTFRQNMHKKATFYSDESYLNCFVYLSSLILLLLKV